MTDKTTATKPRPIADPGDSRAVGRAFAYASRLWMIEGLYLAPTTEGERKVKFILGKRGKNTIDDELVG